MFQKFFSTPIQFFRQKLIHSVFIKDILYRIYWTFPELIREHNPIRDTLLKFSQKNKKVFLSVWFRHYFIRRRQRFSV